MQAMMFGGPAPSTATIEEIEDEIPDEELEVNVCLNNLKPVLYLTESHLYRPHHRSHHR